VVALKANPLQYASIAIRVRRSTTGISVHRNRAMSDAVDLYSLATIAASSAHGGLRGSIEFAGYATNRARCSTVRHHPQSSRGHGTSPGPSGNSLVSSSDTSRHPAGSRSRAGRTRAGSSSSLATASHPCPRLLAGGRADQGYDEQQTRSGHQERHHGTSRVVGRRTTRTTTFVGLCHRLDAECSTRGALTRARLYVERQRCTQRSKPGGVCPDHATMDDGN